MGSSWGGGPGGVGGSPGDSMHRVTLKFKESTAEMAYVRRKTSSSRASGWAASCSACPVYGTGLWHWSSMDSVQHALGLRHAGPLRPHEDGVPVVDDPPEPGIGIGGCGDKSPLPPQEGRPCVAGSDHVSTRDRRDGGAARLLPGLLGPNQGVQLKGFDVETINLVLFIDLIVTGSHLLLPIRWCMLVPIQVGGVFLCVVASLVLSSDANWGEYTIFLTMLTIFASVGKRTIERQER
eukprot:CAMPEP_0179296080 /NCGR_PEP_ID=MMETSP0797-20121207/44753_1 /TAXON_ID=47934 /ORGANISM="Dinophysis acuminata, Strain DAEP01" /LENGTH=236 /DNA_ID=CAMNT_0021005345 /DNA_START=29 /DNA_END=738 /DNA_ORIENTATION=+